MSLMIDAAISRDESIAEVYSLDGLSWRRWCMNQNYDNDPDDYGSY